VTAAAEAIIAEEEQAAFVPSEAEDLPQLARPRHVAPIGALRALPGLRHEQRQADVLTVVHD